MTLRALTVRQPYADAIVHGTKRTENRTRPVPPKYVGLTVLIHAAQALHHSGITADQFTGIAWPGVRSAILGTARITSSHVAEDGCCAPWGQPEPGVWHWVLEDVQALVTPVPCPGALGFWTPTPDALNAVQAQLVVMRP